MSHCLNHTVISPYHIIHVVNVKNITTLYSLLRIDDTQWVFGLLECPRMFTALEIPVSLERRTLGSQAGWWLSLCGVILSHIPKTSHSNLG